MKQLNCSMEMNVKRIKTSEKRLSLCFSPFIFELFVNLNLHLIKFYEKNDIKII